MHLNLRVNLYQTSVYSVWLQRFYPDTQNPKVNVYFNTKSLLQPVPAKPDEKNITRWAISLQVSRTLYDFGFVLLLI